MVQHPLEKQNLYTMAIPTPEKVPEELIKKGNEIWLADYCDIFEWLDHPAMDIRHTTYK